MVERSGDFLGYVATSYEITAASVDRADSRAVVGGRDQFPWS